MKKAILLLLALFFVIPAHAQEGTSIVVFIDEETLVIYVPGNGNVSLGGLGLEVQINGERQSYYLEDYSTFSILNFDVLPAPICFRFEQNNNRNPLPQECPSAQTITQPLSPADVFWFDGVSNQTQTISVLKGVTSIGFCPSGNPRCVIEVNGQGNTSSTTLTSNNQWDMVLDEFDGVEMVRVPTGCFTMGGARDDEKPQQKICFDEDFWIDRYEVSNEIFTALNGAAQNANAWSEADAPRGNVTWFEAQAFCKLRGGRLPTEAEWEYAGRGVDDLIYPWGNEFIPENSVYRDNMQNGRAENVDTLPEGASWVGAFHLTGNMLEWVSSIYADYPYDANDGREDLNNQTDDRVIRGGSWLVDPVDMRLANRSSQSPAYYLDYLGFRCMLPVE